MMATMHPDIEELYRKYSPAVFRLCRRYVRTVQDAQDLVHDVFLKVHHNLDRFERRSSMFTWIYRIALNQCMAYLRQNYSKTSVMPPDEIEQIVGGESFSIDSQILLRRILHDVDEKTRSILFLLYYEGLTQEETAEVLNVNRSAVTKRLQAFKTKMSHSFPREET
jgi:RNA polymerase sigma-70 factor (ECF subfamily)